MLKKNPATKTRATTPSKTLNANCAGNPQPQRRVNSRNPVVRHDSQAAGERFGLPRGERLPDIEYPKKYKAQQQIFPVGQDRHTHSERMSAPQDGFAVGLDA